MDLSTNISKKKLISYSVIIAILSIGMVVLLIQKKLILNERAASVSPTTAPGNQAAEENVGQKTDGNDQGAQTSIDTSLFDNKKFISLKENMINSNNKIAVGKRNPFAPSKNE